MWRPFSRPFARSRVHDRRKHGAAVHLQRRVMFDLSFHRPASPTPPAQVSASPAPHRSAPGRMRRAKPALPAAARAVFSACVISGPFRSVPFSSIFHILALICTIVKKTGCTKRLPCRRPNRPFFLGGRHVFSANPGSARGRRSQLERNRRLSGHSANRLFPLRTRLSDHSAGASDPAGGLLQRIHRLPAGAHPAAGAPALIAHCHASFSTRASSSICSSASAA